MTGTIVNAEGKTIPITFTATLDGKDSPSTTKPDADTIVLTRIDALTISYVNKLAGEPFAIARIYARSAHHAFAEAGTAPITFAILTTTANEIMQPIHERMPVILTAAHAKSWLLPSGTTLFQPFPSELMTTYPVTPKMSKASFNVPEAIQPFIPTLQLQAL